MTRPLSPTAARHSLERYEAKQAKRHESLKPMTVSVTVRVKIDRAAYEREYGETSTGGDVRAHILGVVGSAAESAFQHIDAVTVEEWK